MTPEIEHAEDDQHQSDCQFHGQPEARWHVRIEEDDRCPDQQDRDGVTKSPKEANQARASDASLPADDRAHRDDVVSVGCVAHSQEEPEGRDGDDIQHQSTFVRIGLNGPPRTDP